MAETGLEEEKAFLIQKTHCTEDEAWNFLISEETFFEEKEEAGADLAAITEEELFAFISERSGMEPKQAEKLYNAELEFFEQNGFE